jgi:predicted RNA-binding protein with PIN domain
VIVLLDRLHEAGPGPRLSIVQRVVHPLRKLSAVRLVIAEDSEPVVAEFGSDVQILRLGPADGLRPAPTADAASVRPASPWLDQAEDAGAPGPTPDQDIDAWSAARRALLNDDPSVLDALLGLPHVHLVVDGDNVAADTAYGHPRTPSDERRRRLLEQFSRLVPHIGAEVTCVFDGAEPTARAGYSAPRGLRVLFSKPDDVVEDLIDLLVRAEPPGRPVVVASTDRRVAENAVRAGARPVSAAVLLQWLARDE